MANPAQVQSQVEFALSQSRAESAHHQFEQICRHPTTLGLCPMASRMTAAITTILTPDERALFDRAAQLSDRSIWRLIIQSAKPAARTIIVKLRPKKRPPTSRGTSHRPCCRHL